MHEFFQILPPLLPKSAPPRQKGPRSSFDGKHSPWVCLQASLVLCSSDCCALLDCCWNVSWEQRRLSKGFALNWEENHPAWKAKVPENFLTRGCEWTAKDVFLHFLRQLALVPAYWTWWSSRLATDTLSHVESLQWLQEIEVVSWKSSNHQWYCWTRS